MVISRKNRKIFTRAIVISEMKYKDSSKIITLYSREKGKLQSLIKGVYRINSKNLSISQQFCESNYTLIEGKNFYYISSAEILNTNLELRNEIDKIIYANIICEILDKSMIELEPNRKIYDLLQKTLTIMNSTEDLLSLIISFELKYLSFLGYRPKLDVGEKNFFSLSDGITQNMENVVAQLNKNDVYYLNKLLYTTLEQKKLYDESRKLFLHSLLIKYIKYNLEIDEINSYNFIG